MWVWGDGETMSVRDGEGREGGSEGVRDTDGPLLLLFVCSLRCIGSIIGLLCTPRLHPSCCSLSHTLLLIIMY